MNLRTELISLRRDFAKLQHDTTRHQLNLLAFNRELAQRRAAQAAMNHSAQDAPVLPSENPAFRPTGNNPSQISGNADLRQSIFEKCIKQSQQTGENLEELLEQSGYTNI